MSQFFNTNITSLVYFPYIENISFPAYVLFKLTADNGHLIIREHHCATV